MIMVHCTLPLFSFFFYCTLIFPFSIKYIQHNFYYISIFMFRIICGCVVMLCACMFSLKYNDMYTNITMCSHSSMYIYFILCIMFSVL